MIIKQIKEEALQADHPVAKSLFHCPDGKILAIGFKSGVLMKDHKTAIPARLYVFEGSVEYTETGKSPITLTQYEDVEIPVGIIHNVVAKENSLCLLIQQKTD